MSRFQWHLIVGVIFCVLIGCTRHGSTQKTSDISVRLRAEPESLQWVRSLDMNAFRVIEAMMTPLLKWHPKKGLMPGAAIKWNADAKYKKFIFTLDSTHVWDDGKPVRPDDFIRTFQWVMNPTNASPMRSLFEGIIDPKSIRKLDETSFEVSLKKSVPYFLEMMVVLFPLHVDENPQKQRVPQKVNGAYRFSSWKPGQEIILERVHRTAVTPHHLRFLILEEDATAVRLFETKTLDLVDYPSPMDWERLCAMTPNICQVYPTWRQFYLGVNAEHASLKSAEVRRRWLGAVKRKGLSQLKPGFWDAANGWIPDEFFSEKKEMRLPEDRAVKGEAESELLFPSLDDYKLLAEALQGQWMSLGFTVKLVPMEWKVYLKQRTQKSTQFFLAAWSGTHPHPHTFLEKFVADSANNLVRLPSTKTQGWELAHQESEWRKINQVLSIDEAVLWPLVRENYALLVSPRVRSVWVSPLGKVDFSSLEISR